MERMGHSTTRTALIYQHRTSERDKLIADAPWASWPRQNYGNAGGRGHAAGTERQACIVRRNGRRLLITALNWAEAVERVTRIELALSAWEARGYRRQGR